MLVDRGMNRRNTCLTLTQGDACRAQHLNFVINLPPRQSESTSSLARFRGLAMFLVHCRARAQAHRNSQRQATSGFRAPTQSKARCAAQGHEAAARATMPGHLFKRQHGHYRYRYRSMCSRGALVFPARLRPAPPCLRRRRGLAACGMRMGNTRRISRALVLL